MTGIAPHDLTRARRTPPSGPFHNPPPLANFHTSALPPDHGAYTLHVFTEPAHQGGLFFMRRRMLTTALAAAAVTGSLTALSVVPAHAAEYDSALKVRGVQYDAPGRDSNSCASGNTDEEYLTVKNYSSSKTVNLKGYVVKDAAGTRFTFTATHYLQPGDYVKLRGGYGSDSDAGNVVYRDSCNFLWNNDRDTIYLYKPSGSRADVHAYSKSGSDPDNNGYITFHR